MACILWLVELPAKCRCNFQRIAGTLPHQLILNYRAAPMTTKDSAHTRLLGLCTLVFLTGMFVLLGCTSPTESLSFLGHNIVNDDEDEKDDEHAKSNSDSKKENENDLLKEMKKPLFAMFLTGRQYGYIEPCGCTGLFNQKGGLMRRHRVQQILQERGWELVSVDAGNQIRRFGQQPVIKLQHTLRGLCNVMKYDAVGFGPDDLKIPTIDLLQTISNIIEDEGPFVSANVDLMGAGLQRTSVIVERGGKKIGVTHLLDDEITASLKGNSELEMKSVAEAMKTVVPEIANCDFKVAVLRTDKVEKAKKFAETYPVFDLLVHTTSAGEPEKLPTKVKSGNHTTSLIQLGTKGMYVGVVGCYENNGKLELKYERVPLDGRFTDSKKMEKIFEAYQNELRLLYTEGKLMDVKPRPHPSGFKFVGSQICFDCHDEEFEIWEDGVEGDGGPHFIATDDIVDPPNHRGHIARHYDPECISCHATGWHPRDFYPYESGFISLKKHDHLTGNGCENCHGPGSEHVSVERAKDKGQQVAQGRVDEMRKAMRLTIKEAKNEHCGQCHDADNSPDFLKEGAFEEYWEKIKH